MIYKILRNYTVFVYIIDHLNIISSYEEYRSILEDSIQKNKKISIVTPNTDILRQGLTNPNLRRALYNSDYSIIDGLPIVLILRMIKRLKVVKLSGSGTFRTLLEDFNKEHRRVFLFGSNSENIKKAIEVISIKFKNIFISGVSPKITKDVRDFEKYLEAINIFSPQILVLGLGCPKQELFTYFYKDRLQTNVILNLGATIDFISGNVKEPPNWSKKIGVAPIFRIFSEPKRLILRYLYNLGFLVVIILGFFINRLFIAVKKQRA